MQALELYCVILAGGRGTRFWPRSRRKNAKQVLNIIGERSMIQKTVKRVSPLIPPDRIFILTNTDLGATIRKQVPEVPANQVIEEPVGRSTAAAIGLGSLYIQQRDPAAVMVSLHADHEIGDSDRFLDALELSAEIASEGENLVTIGLRPAYPATGYGYVHAGAQVKKRQGVAAHRILEFVEKPDADKATELVQQGNWFWNTGTFTWRVSTYLSNLERFVAKNFELLERIRAGLGSAAERNTIEKLYPQMESISVDHGIMEKTQNAIVVQGTFSWADVGSWRSVYDLSPHDAEGHAACVKQLITIQSKGCYVHSPEKLVALVGVEDLVVIDTGDALLVCKKELAERVGDVVKKLEKDGAGQYL